jgi:hypothetical protein
MILFKKSREVLKMAKKERNLKKESEWRKTKYKRFVVDVDSSFAKLFLEKLEQNGEKYSNWVKDRMKNYLEKN